MHCRSPPKHRLRVYGEVEGPLTSLNNIGEENAHRLTLCQEVYSSLIKHDIKLIISCFFLKNFCLNFTLLGNTRKKLLRPLDIHNFISYLFFIIKFINNIKLLRISYREKSKINIIIDDLINSFCMDNRIDKKCLCMIQVMKNNYTA